MKVAHLVRIAANIDQVSTRLMKFRDVWPSADLSTMLSKHPYELLYAQSVEDIVNNVSFLRKEILAPMGIVDDKQIDAMCSRNPLLFLDLNQTTSAIAELNRLLGGDRNQESSRKSSAVVNMIINDKILIQYLFPYLGT